MAKVDDDYERLIRVVKERHQKKFPSHFVQHDDLAVWCQDCQKGIDTRTDGPHPDEIASKK